MATTAGGGLQLSLHHRHNTSLQPSSFHNRHNTSLQPSSFHNRHNTSLQPSSFHNHHKTSLQPSSFHNRHNTSLQPSSFHNRHKTSLQPSSFHNRHNTSLQPSSFHNRHKTSLQPSSFHNRHNTSLICAAAVSKQGHRFLTSVAITDDPATTDRLIRKFVASSSKSVALDAISHLVSPNNTSSFSRLSPLAFPLYSTISRTSWFNWNAKLIADVIASLYKHQRFDEAQTLVSEVETKLGSKERDLCNFYCNLIDSHSKHRSKKGIFDSYERINQLPSHSSSNYLKKRSYESIIGGLSVIDLPHEAETFMVEMKNKGIKPSVFEYRSLSYAYGRLGLFEDMKRVISLMEDKGFELDVVSSNMVISSLGSHNELKEMVYWLKRMKNSKISFSIRTYNSVLDHCPTITSIVEHPKEIKPTSLEALFQILKDDERILMRELIDPSVLEKSMELYSLELKVDLHGMHLGCAYLILLQWFDDIRIKYGNGINNDGIPNKVTVVCGVGKHSVIRGESPVKELVKEMMIQMKSPLKIDRKNVGCFVANGKVFVNFFFLNGKLTHTHVPAVSGLHYGQSH